MATSIFSLPDWKKGTFGGVNYHYVYVPPSSPEKATFLCFHGFPHGPETFRKLLPKLQADGYGAVIFEQVGYGQSDKPTDLAAYSRVTIAESIAELVKAEGLEKVVVLGHDFGSLTAIAFTLAFPSIAQGLILIGIPFFPPDGQPFPAKMLNNAYLEVLGYEPYAYQEWLTTEEAPGVVSEHIEAFVHGLLSDDLGEGFLARGALKPKLEADLKGPCSAWVQQEDIDLIVSYLKANDMNALLNWYRYSLTYKDRKELKLPSKLATPYLSVQCKLDPVVPPGLSDGQLKACSDITVKELELGHWAMEQDPDAVWKEVDEWVKAKGL